jgi:hypothetical protein
MTDDSHDQHKTDAEKKKEEAQRRLQEALLRKQNKPHAEAHHQQKPSGFGQKFSPAPIRRGPRGG